MLTRVCGETAYFLWTIKRSFRYYFNEVKVGQCQGDNKLCTLKLAKELTTAGLLILRKRAAKIFTPASINIYFSVYLTMLYRLNTYIGSSHRIRENLKVVEVSGYSSRTRTSQQTLGYVEKKFSD